MRRTGRREGPAGATALLSVQAARNSRSFARALLEGEGDRRGLSPSLSLHEASELVILSAAGAKDLLAHRCEGPADGKDPQARRTCLPIDAKDLHLRRTGSCEGPLQPRAHPRRERP